MLELGASLSYSKTLSGLLGEGTQFEQANIHLDFKFKFNKFIEQNFPFVVAKEYLVLGQDYKSKFNYIPNIDLLKVLITNQETHQEVIHERHHSHVPYDTCDGTISDGIWSKTDCCIFQNCQYGFKVQK